MRNDEEQYSIWREKRRSR
ncbi:hypothetical protein ABZ599_37680 [Streptomyces misionensis]